MEHNKEVFFEEKKLEQVLNILEIETLNYITKRKYITEYILEARKKYIEEYKDDEDQVIQYFDHENYIKEEYYKMIDKRLKEIVILKDSPYFGKITFSEDENQDTLYIGRFGVSREGEVEPVIVDWRAPVSSLFYKGTLGKASYISPDGEVNVNLEERRQFLIKKGTLMGMFDSALDVKDEILQMVLTANSSDKLKDIVMTIQEEQDNIIRAPKNGVVMVDGVAGSGKTTIALHRTSYLIYNNRKELSDKVLILGPNNIFMDYISQVLPTLGEGGVDQMTFEEFAFSQIGIDEELTGFSNYIESAMLGYDEELNDYKYKSSIKFSEKLNQIIEDMNINYFKASPVVFFGEVIVSEEEIRELFTKYYEYMPLFKRSEKIKRVLFSKIKNKRDDYVRELNRSIKEKIKSLSEEELMYEKANIEYTKSLKIREIVREVMNAKNDIEQWLNHESIIELYKRVTDTVKLGYMDLAGILYLMIKLEGKKSEKQYKHIVIDEAQDYTATQFRVIKELTGCKSYTIVGDSNQRLIDTDESVAMLNLDKIFEQDIKEYKLNKSYRSTQQIMEYANRFLKEDKIVPLVREGEKVLEETVEIEELVDTIKAIIEDYQDDGLENIAVIIRDRKQMNTIASMLKNKIKISAFQHEDMIYQGGIVLLPAYFAKGLEFDGVILVESKNDKKIDLVKYIMATRALHRLSVLELTC